jgi:catechol 2,3-dioxygenase-like lactoylglutathione lyase family enzyme
MKRAKKKFAKLNHLLINVRDAKKSRDWYVNNLGLSTVAASRGRRHLRERGAIGNLEFGPLTRAEGADACRWHLPVRERLGSGVPRLRSG